MNLRSRTFNFQFLLCLLWSLISAKTLVMTRIIDMHYRKLILKNKFLIRIERPFHLVRASLLVSRMFQKVEHRVVCLMERFIFFPL